MTTATMTPDLTTAAASRLFVEECSKHVESPDYGPGVVARASVRDVSHTVNEDDAVWWECEAWLGDGWYPAQFCELDPQVAIVW